MSIKRNFKTIKTFKLNYRIKSIRKKKLLTNYWEFRLKHLKIIQKKF